MGWTLFFMFVVLKIPIVFLGLIIWYAIRDEPDPAGDEPEGNGGGNQRVRKPRPHPPQPRPRRPRRGPHGDPAPAPPPRVRDVVARARELEH